MTKRNSNTLKPKPLFIERINKLLINEKDIADFWEISKKEPQNFIRCNTLKISPKKLKEKLENEKNWIVNQPFKEYPEIMIIVGKKPTQSEKEILIDKDTALLFPGELGRSLEHLLGYFYIQEMSSMLPVIALNPKENDIVLDLCSAPGSKTTQMASQMNNTGTIIANEMSLGRLRILASNLERCGVTNTIITRKEGQAFCKRMKELKIKFDKISVDAPCSGEGTIRSSPKTYLMWNTKTIKYLSKIQKQLFAESFKQLKIGGELVYSTCTHAPEENEEVVDEMLKLFKNSIEIIPIKIPLKSREGIIKWEEKNYDPRVKSSLRIYPQDNNTEGFFISKFKKLKEIEE